MAVKRTITFRDIEGNPVSQDWYFSLGRTDVIGMDSIRRHADDLPKYFAAIQKGISNLDLIDLYREMLLKAAGQRKGSLLVKGPEVMEEFQYSGAFEQLFTELLDAEDGGAEFFNSILPDDVRTQVEEELQKKYTKDEMLNMTDEDFAAIAGTDTSKMTLEQMQIAYLRKSHKAA